MSSPDIDPRHIARAMALQQLFAEATREGSALTPEDLLSSLEQQTYDAELFTQLIEGVKAHQSNIDSAIVQLAPNWPINQIALTDLVILRLAIWEAFVSDTTPAKVVINEAIELAKTFGGINSSSFVNGVLGSLINNEDLKNTLHDSNRDNQTE